MLEARVVGTHLVHRQAEAGSVCPHARVSGMGEHVRHSLKATRICDDGGEAELFEGLPRLLGGGPRTASLNRVTQNEVSGVATMEVQGHGEERDEVVGVLAIAPAAHRELGKRCAPRPLRCYRALNDRRLRCVEGQVEPTQRTVPRHQDSLCFATRGRVRLEVVHEPRRRAQCCRPQLLELLIEAAKDHLTYEKRGVGAYRNALRLTALSVSDSQIKSVAEQGWVLEIGLAFAFEVSAHSMLWV